MARKIRRTFTIDRTVDAVLRERSKASRWSLARTVNQALQEYTHLDQASLKSIRRIAGILDVEAWQVLNNIMKTFLQEVETRKNQLDPAALCVDELIQTGANFED